MKDAVVGWYQSPENEFLRREINWSFQYVFRTRAFWWIVGYTLVKLGAYYLTRLYMDNVTIRGSWPFQYVLFSIQSLPPLLVIVPLWLSVMRRRIFVLFGPDRIQDIATSTIQPREMWPALLVAPALVLTAVTQIGKFILSLWTWFPRLRMDFIAGYNLAADFGWIGISLASGLLSAAITYLMYTAAAVYFSLPTRSLVRACMTALVIWLGWTAIGSIAQGAIARVLSPASSLTQVVSWTYFFVCLACFAMLASCFVRRLRRRSYWNRLLNQFDPDSTGVNS